MKNYEELLDELIRRIESDRESARTRMEAFIGHGNKEAASFNHGESVALGIVLCDIKELITELETK